MQTAMKKYTREEYLAKEQLSEEKHELYQGEIFAMAGGTCNHGAIGLNITAALKNKLRGKSCQPTNSDVCIETPSGLLTYPDATVFCGQAVLSEQQRTLLNPVVIIEVLSPSTRHYDRSEKFRLYRSIPTFHDYLLVDSEKVGVEYFRKVENNEWLFREYLELSDSIYLHAIYESLQLSELYNEVHFT